MIYAIIPVPCRYRPGTLLNSTRIIESAHCANWQARNIMGGRTIRVLPLYFYKVLSQYGTCSYEHTFASDSIIDPVNLRYAENFKTKIREDNYGGTLVPISIKRSDMYVTQTFLFSRAINFLLNTYKEFVPIDEQYESETISHELCTDYSQICSICEFKKHMLREISNPLFDSNAITEYQKLIMGSLTPERPNTIPDYVSEILSLGLQGKELFSYIDDFCYYESQNKISPLEVMLMDQYSYELDPITQLCIQTPSYLYGFQLRPHLAGEMILKNYSTIGYNQIDNEKTRAALNLNFESADASYWADNIIEEICQIADKEFDITISLDNVIVNSGNFNKRITERTFDNLIRTLKHLFLDVSTQCRYDRLVIYKTISDEVFITCYKANNLTGVTFYINISWYHLLSPSLINKNLMI